MKYQTKSLKKKVKKQFDPDLWAKKVETQAVLQELQTHIFNIRRCWNRGNTIDMIHQAERAEIKIQELIDSYAEESQ